MVFSSLLFLTFFLPITAGLYTICPKRMKNGLLLICSLVFYAWGEPAYILLMLFTTFYIWLLGLITERVLKKNHKTVARVLLVCAVAVSLGILAVYKYTAFIVENLPFLQDTVLADFQPALPIGISFYTFQALSYSVDVYRGKVKAQRNWMDFALYISFFPQLIAGPIVRYTDMEHQLRNRKANLETILSGIRVFGVGLGKKVLLANQIGLLWKGISEAGTISFLGAWLGAGAFTLQIYFDFSGYSDMAVGLGRLFGFQFPENFHYPYQANSITDFWRRWHISLSTWFREYVYIPLGGNRKGRMRSIRNLFIVWLLTGLWHGAAWQFVLWGVYYFLFLCVEKLFLNRFLEKIPAALRHGYTMLVVIFGWGIFSGETTAASLKLCKAMIGRGVPLAAGGDLFLFTDYLVLLCIGILAATELPKKCCQKLVKKFPSPAWGSVGNLASMFLLLLSIAFLMTDSYNPFLYFRF